MKDEWSKWIEHDGKGCPCVGHFVQTIDENSVLRSHIAHSFQTEGCSSVPVIDAWLWDDPNRLHGMGGAFVIQYRIRKPRGMALIEESLNVGDLVEVPVIGTIS